MLTRRIAYLDDLIAGFSTHSPAMDAESLVLSTLEALRTRPDFDACTVYRVDGLVATPSRPATPPAIRSPAASRGASSDFPAAAQAVAGRAPVVVTADADSPPMSPAAMARFSPAEASPASC